MKNKLALIPLLAALSITVAHAGYLQPAGLTYLDGDGFIFVSGDLSTVAYSDDPNAFIGCGSRTFLDHTWAFCQAGSSERGTLICNTEDPGLIDAIRNIADSAYLGFSVNDNGECVHVATSTQSFYLQNAKETGKRKKSKGNDEDDD